MKTNIIINLNDKKDLECFKYIHNLLDIVNQVEGVQGLEAVFEGSENGIAIQELVDRLDGEVSSYL